MEVFAIVLILILMVFLWAMLLTKHLILKKQIRNLAEQMQNLSQGITEKMLDISLVDKDLEHLTAILNQYNEKQRCSVNQATQHEEHLKETIANISHDLRTPLTVILGHLQLLKKQNLSNEQCERVEIILHKANRMALLVGEFYELSVLDEKKAIPQRKKINLLNIIINLITENVPAMESKNIKPLIHLPDYSMFIYSDQGMVERIIQNLLTNAICYSSGNIKITLEQVDKIKWHFKIDNEVEKPEEIDIEQIFERFYTGDQSRHGGSTGVGLAVVKILTEQLGHEIKATLQENVLGIGVTFKCLEGNDYK